MSIFSGWDRESLLVLKDALTASPEGLGALALVCLIGMAAIAAVCLFVSHKVGGFFTKVANALPFIHAVEAARAAAAGDLAALPGHLAVVGGYALALMLLAVFAFTRVMRGGKR